MGIQNPATSSDPYVRTNIYALQAVDMAGDGNRELQNAIDSRIGAALCRRGLLWEQPKRCYHLTAAGRLVLGEFDADRANGCERAWGPDIDRATVIHVPGTDDSESED